MFEFSSLVTRSLEKILKRKDPKLEPFGTSDING